MPDIKLTVNKDDLERLLTKLARLSPQNQVDTFRGAWRQATIHVLGVLRSNVTGGILNVKTGALSQGMQFKIDEKKITSIIGNRVLSGNPVPYTAIHEFGGDIYPIRAKWLRFKIGNDWVMTKHVRIPARKYMSRSVTEAEPGVMREMEDWVNKELNRK